MQARLHIEERERIEALLVKGGREDMIQRRDVALLGKRPDVRVTPPNFVFPHFFFRERAGREV